MNVDEMELNFRLKIIICVFTHQCSCYLSFYILFTDSDFDFFIELSREPPNTRPASTIGKAMNILKQSGNFTNFVPISHARVPILKCYHMPTGYQCDINFSDSYGILNSPIVARLLTYDARIYVLATILKYWTKVHDCAGKNRISNYAIVWMLLFYLQQLAEPILPPIIEFQKRVHPYFVNGYNFAFDDRLANRTKNQSRSSELLMGFFKFYKTFDFESNVICPLFGKVFRKADILSKSLPEFKAYHGMLEMNPNLTQMQFNKCICIQDPFEITHSIPGAIAHLEFSKILLKFELAAEIIDFELKSEGESTKLLLLIFDAVKFNQYVQEKMPKNDIKQQTAVIRSQNSATSKGTLQIKPTDYHLSIVREILTKQSNGSNAKIENLTINRSWAEHVIEFIGLMLKDIFILKMESTSNNMVNETETPSTSADITSENDENSDNLMKRFVISGNRDVFLGRKQTKKINVNSLNIEMLDSQERFKNTAIEIQLKAAVQLSANMSTFDAITINFEDLIKTKKNNSFKTFFTNFDQNLNNLLKIYFLYKIGTLSRNVS